MGTGRRLITQVNNCGICGNELKDLSHLGIEVGGGASEGGGQGGALTRDGVWVWALSSVGPAWCSLFVFLA